MSDTKQAKKLTPAQRQQIQEMLKQGESVPKIAKAVGCSTGTVYHYQRKLKVPAFADEPPLLDGASWDDADYLMLLTRHKGADDPDVVNQCRKMGLSAEAAAQLVSWMESHRRIVSDGFIASKEQKIAELARAKKELEAVQNQIKEEKAQRARTINNLQQALHRSQQEKLEGEMMVKAMELLGKKEK